MSNLFNWDAMVSVGEALRPALRHREVVSTVQSPEAFPQFLIAGMRVNRRRQRTHMPREPLREEQLSRVPVDVRDRCVP